MSNVQRKVLPPLTLAMLMTVAGFAWLTHSDGTAPDAVEKSVSPAPTTTLKPQDDKVPPAAKPSLVPDQTLAFSMRVGSREIPLYPSDPASPWSRTWIAPLAPHVIKHTHDSTTGRGTVTVAFPVSEVARWQAQERLAQRLRAEGHPCDAREIAIVTMPLDSYKVTLRVAGKAYPIANVPHSANTTQILGEIALAYTIPPEHVDANTVLGGYAQDAAVQIDTVHEFKQVILSSATAEMLRSSAQQVLEDMAGKGDIIVDRRGKSEFTQRLLQRLRLTTTGPNASKATQNCLLWVEKQMAQAVHPLSFEELLELPDKFNYYTVKTGQEHLHGESYDNVDNERLSHAKLKQECETAAKHIKTASSKKAGKELFFQELKARQKIDGEAGGWGFHLRIGIEKEFSSLNKGESERLDELYQHGEDESSTSQRLESDELKSWKGSAHSSGVKASGIELYRLSASGIAARCIFSHDDTVQVGEQTVTFTHLIGLHVEPQPEDTDVCKGLLDRIRVLENQTKANQVLLDRFPSIEKRLAEQATDVGALQKLAERKWQAIVRPDQGLLGATTLLKGNVKYVADTDGFVLATSSWSHEGLRIDISNTPQDNPISSAVVGNTDSAGLSVCSPVKKGSTYQVTYYRPGSNDPVNHPGMRVYFIPLELPAKLDVVPVK